MLARLMEQATRQVEILNRCALPGWQLIWFFDDKDVADAAADYLGGVVDEVRHVRWNRELPEGAPPGRRTRSGLAAAATSTAPAEGATAKTLLFQRTISVCRNVLNTREFSVTDGGLRVTLSADWEPADGAFPPTSPPPIREYELSLAERDVFFDDPQDSSMIPVGRTYSLAWEYLEEDDDYYLTIDVPDHDSAWCLRGDISVSTFSAPPPVYLPDPGFA